MLKLTDLRLGKELGLAGVNARKPAFEIVNDAHALNAALTSSIITLKYSMDGDLYKSAPQWPKIEAKRIEFSRRADALNANAVKAAHLSDEIRAFAELLAQFKIEQDCSK